MEINATFVFLLFAASSAVLASPTPQASGMLEASDGQSSVKIVGGNRAAEGDFPFIVSLQRRGNHFCGGTLVNADTVVTAAHCSTNANAETVSVRAGSLVR